MIIQYFSLCVLFMWLDKELGVNAAHNDLSQGETTENTI